MGNTDARNIVSRIVAAAPTGKTLVEAEVLEWKKTPGVSELCKAVQLIDMPALFSLMESADWPAANLATSLLRAFKDAELKVKKQFLDTWNNKQRPLEVRLCVMYPLLDYPDLPRAMHEDFYATVLNNMDRFKTFALTYFATPSDVLPTAIDRIRDPKYPVSKRWIYLCNALASPDTEGSRQFIESYKDDSDKFVAKVAQNLTSQTRGEQSK
ncbi:MAG: hypothetical protein NT159_19415 [Proteobacteria bacterium]|nr:hypothetical protein [Pseudomonadota bacterium]